MKRMLALLFAVTALSAAQSAQNPRQTLYYLDETGNVCSVGIRSSGRPAAHPRKLTSGGAYDGYSVSPDGAWGLSWKLIGRKHGEFPVYKCFVQKDGGPEKRILDPLMADGEPWAEWSPRSKYLIIRVPQQVQTETIIYSLDRRRVVCDTDDLLPVFCEDQAYSFVLEDKGDEDNSRAWLRILDMKTGKMTKVAQVSFKMYGEPPQSVWFGKSHRFAFIDIKGNVGAGEVHHGKSGPLVKRWILRSKGGCSDLRYVPGRGIYFVAESGAARTAHYSTDLRALNKAETLPAMQTQPPRRYTEMRSGRFHSPDGLLFATVETHRLNGPHTIQVYDKSGRCAGIARGTRPMWQGAGRD